MGFTGPDTATAFRKDPKRGSTRAGPKKERCRIWALSNPSPEFLKLKNRPPPPSCGGSEQAVRPHNARISHRERFKEPRPPFLQALALRPKGRKKSEPTAMEGRLSPQKGGQELPKGIIGGLKGQSLCVSYYGIPRSFGQKRLCPSSPPRLQEDVHLSGLVLRCLNHGHSRPSMTILYLRPLTATQTLTT